MYLNFTEQRPSTYVILSGNYKIGNTRPRSPSLSFSPLLSDHRPITCIGETRRVISDKIKIQKLCLYMVLWKLNKLLTWNEKVIKDILMSISNQISMDVTNFWWVWKMRNLPPYFDSAHTFMRMQLGAYTKLRYAFERTYNLSSRYESVTRIFLCLSLSLILYCFIYCRRIVFRFFNDSLSVFASIFEWVFLLNYDLWFCSHRQQILLF